MIGYICTRNKNKNIKDYIKYEIGKRYKLTKTLINYNISSCGFESECDLDDFYSNDKIYKIKIYDNNIGNTTKDFKILHEINYKDLLNSKNRDERVISAIKNREESVLNDFVKCNAYYAIRTIIKSKVHKYLDEITTIAIKNEKIIPYIVYLIRIYCPFLISEQGRKCDLDILVHDEDEDIRKAVAYHGYDDHLDILAKENNYNINKIINKLRGKRAIGC